MTDQEKYEQFEGYFLGELSDEERRRLERQIAEDPDFAREVLLHRHIFTALTDKKSTAFRDKLDAIQARRDAAGPATSGAVRRLSARTWWAIAATAAVLIVAAWWLYLTPSGPSTPEELFTLAEQLDYPAYPPELFPDKARIERDAGGPQSAANPIDTLFTAIRSDYQNKKYPDALAGLGRLPVDSVGIARLNYYRGMLLLRSARAREAVQSLEQVSADSEFYRAARWNRALALLRSGEISAARTAFEELAAAGIQPEQAGRMLKELRRLD